MPNTVRVESENRKYCAVTWGTARFSFRSAIVECDLPRAEAGMQETDPQTPFGLTVAAAANSFLLLTSFADVAQR
jgi:hypothetical protein